jgi:hypothetical protein
MKSCHNIAIYIVIYMERNTYSFHDMAIWADSMETVERVLNHAFLMSIGIAPLDEPPRYIPCPSLFTVNYGEIEQS